MIGGRCFFSTCGFLLLFLPPPKISVTAAAAVAAGRILTKNAKRESRIMLVILVLVLILISSCPHYHRYRPFFVLSFRFVLFLLLDVVAGSNPCEAVATFAVQHSLFFVSWRNVAVQHQHRCDGEHEQEPSVTFLAWM